MMKHTTMSMIWLLLFAAAATAGPAAVDGVFGLAPVTDTAAMAVWVPLESGESISGVAWYNNDGSQVFPELLAVAGDAGEPAVLEAAVVVGQNVAGTTLGWSQWTFAQPLGSATPGLFLIFRLPVGGEFVTEGEGAGLGYTLGDGQVRCWLSVDEGKWDMLSPEFQMAVEPIMNDDKSGGVLVLEGGGAYSLAGGNDQPVATTAALRAAPNPFNPQTEISFTLPQAGDVELTVFDVRGRQVRSLLAAELPAGSHAVTWDGRDGDGRAQPSGVYLALLKAGEVRLTRRLTLVQ